MRRVVVWRVTERCDSACGFCAYDARLARTRRDADPAAVLRGAARLAADRRPLLVSFLGGEPYLWPPLVEVTAALRARGVAVALTTNGRALARSPHRIPGASIAERGAATRRTAEGAGRATRERRGPYGARPAASEATGGEAPWERWRRFSLDALDELTLSIDGVPEVHDALRGGGGAALLEVLADLRARRRGPRPLLRVNTVLMRGTAGRYAELAAQLGAADELTVNALGARDRPEFAAGRTLAPEDVARFAAEAARLRAAGVPLRGGPGYWARLDATARGVARPAASCPVEEDFVFVDIDGRCAPCCDALGERGVPVEALPRRAPAARARACDDCPSTQANEKYW